MAEAKLEVRLIEAKNEAKKDEGLKKDEGEEKDKDEEQDKDVDMQSAGEKESGQTGDEADKKGKDEGQGEEDTELSRAMHASNRRFRKKLEVFVGGLDKEAIDDDLRKVFEKVGEITEIQLMKNFQTGKNEGYGFVRYATVAEAKRAIKELIRQNEKERFRIAERSSTFSINNHHQYCSDKSCCGEYFCAY